MLIAGLVLAAVVGLGVFLWLRKNRVSVDIDIDKKEDK